MANKKKNQHFNPAKSKSRKGVTSASQWNKIKTVEVSLPSGNVCLLRRPGLVQLLSANIFPDDLLKIIGDAMEDARSRLKGQEPEERPEKNDDELFEELMNNPAKLTRMYEIFDRVLVYAVVDPVVAFHKFEEGDKIPDGLSVGDVIPDELRDPEKLYSDHVDDFDKNFIFSFVTGGSADLSRFRQEQAAIVAGVENGEGLLSSAQSALQHQ